MIDVVDTRIKAFGKTPKAGFVSPSEQLITLTIGQLQELVTQAVAKAIEPLQAELSDTQAIITCQAEKITTLESKVVALEADQEIQAENSFIQLQLIHDLREATKKEVQPLQKDRADILRALIVANGGKMLSKDARQKMRLDKVLFSQLLAKAEDIENQPYRIDKRQKLLVLK
jgi:hypothetical protein